MKLIPQPHYIFSLEKCLLNLCLRVTLDGEKLLSVGILSVSNQPFTKPTDPVTIFVLTYQAINNPEI
jgi:hypothetical protein